MNGRQPVLARGRSLWLMAPCLRYLADVANEACFPLSHPQEDARRVQ